jgi:hypothetical protein
MLLLRAQNFGGVQADYGRVERIPAGYDKLIVDAQAGSTVHKEVVSV